MKHFLVALLGAGALSGILIVFSSLLIALLGIVIADGWNESASNMAATLGASSQR